MHTHFMVVYVLENRLVISGEQVLKYGIHQFRWPITAVLEALEN